MQVISTRVGLIQTNCYLVYNDDSCLLVDPGAQRV